MNKKEIKFLIISFISWRVLLFVFLFLAASSLPLQMKFLGGGLTNYLTKPYLWAWANFDGEHYLSIAQKGYGFGQQAFFPVYPFLLKILSFSKHQDLQSLVWSGLLISNASFFLALFGLYKLIRIDYSEPVARLTIFLLLFFPTSFYFGSVYTEGLFFALIVWAFYLVRKGKSWYGSILAAISSATRFVGVLMLPVFIMELFSQKKKKLSLKHLASLLIIPLGLILYMYFLNKQTGDPLAFIHTLSGFGEQRSTTPISLPQVFYRYFFKILPNINYSYFPIVFSTLLELTTALGFLTLSILSFFRLPLSYSLYLSFVYLIPTLSGSFSSLPRYVLVGFPAFILASLYVTRLPRVLQLLIFALLSIGLGIATSLFVRGYWLS